MCRIKRVLSIILIIAFILSLTGCGGGRAVVPDETGDYTVNYHDSVALPSIEAEVEFSDFLVENLTEDGTGDLSFYITLHLPDEVDPTVYATWFSNFSISGNTANCELVTMGNDGMGQYVQILEDNEEPSDTIIYHVFCPAKVSEDTYSLTCSANEDLNFEFVISGNDVGTTLFEQAEELFANGQYDPSLAYYERITGTQKEQADMRVQSIECLKAIDSLNATIESNYTTTNDFWGQYMDSLFNTSISAEGSYDVTSYTYNLRIYFSSMFSDIAGIFGASLGDVVGNSGGIEGTQAQETYEVFREAGFDGITCRVEHCDYEGNVIQTDVCTKEIYEQEQEAKIQQEKAAGIEHVGDFTIQNGTLIEYSGNAENIEIPDTVTAIGERVFSQNSNLKTVVMPDSVVEIGMYAFSGCENLCEVAFSSNLQKIGLSAFEGCSLESIVYPSSIQQVDSYAFSGNEIKSVTFLPGITAIPREACSFHYYNATLEEVVIPEGVKIIEGYAFYDLHISSLTLPVSLETVKEFAFDSVTIDEINYNGSVSQYSNNVEVENYEFSNNTFRYGPIKCNDGIFEEVF